ncbi:MAG: PIN domain-containing protein [Lachnospiraceae bacterium]|nr:PIN domain-containing protein [Lachnospiraceae bacterium]
MEYISSDTNVWLDFATINRLEFPFKLPYTYIMNEDAIEDELLSPKELRETLVGLGLKAVELSEEEFYLAEEYNAKYQKPSLYDCVALAIAKVRGITLMTGDGPLRKAAEQENVDVIGTIGVLDRLYEEQYIKKEEYVDCMKELLLHNGQKVRLPEKELQKRIE